MRNLSIDPVEWFPVLTLSDSGAITDRFPVDDSLIERYVKCLTEFAQIQRELAKISGNDERKAGDFEPYEELSSS